MWEGGEGGGKERERETVGERESSFLYYIVLFIFTFLHIYKLIARIYHNLI